MAALTLRPNADTGTNQWAITASASPGGETARWQVLDEVVTNPTPAPATANDFIRTSTTGQVSEVALADVGALQSGRTLDSIVANIYAQSGGTRRTIVCDLRYNVGGTGADTSLGTVTVPNNATTAQWFTISVAAGSLATLTDAELNSLRLRFTTATSASTSTTAGTVYAAYVVVTYTPPNTPPVAAFTRDITNPITNQTITFTDTSTDADGTIVSRAWDLDNDGAFDDGTGSTASTSFATEGSKTVRLQVTDDRGGTNIATMTFTVSLPANTPPVASFTRDVVSPAANQTITLTDTSTDPDGTIVSRAWDLDNDGAFDDGSGTTATVSFPAAGTYTVALQVTDDRGGTNSTSMTINVAADTVAPIATITSVQRSKISDKTGVNSTDINFTVNEPFNAYEVRLVSSTGAQKNTGTLIESGGAGAAGTPITVTITYAEAVAAGALEGNNIIKIFVQDVAGNWSDYVSTLLLPSPTLYPSPTLFPGSTS